MSNAPGTPSEILEGRELPDPIVVVDAQTFAPLELSVVSASSSTGHPILQSSITRYLTYEELPATPASFALLSFASHPGTKTEVEPIVTQEH